MTRPVVISQRETPAVPVQRRAPVMLATTKTREGVPAAAAIRALTLPLALLAAVIAQLAVVNRLPLPAATAPDLVLLTVTAIAVLTGPAAGTLAGFAGGLALDVAPPAAHYVGEYALVFCLAGYTAARVRGALTDATGERDPVTTLAVMAAATVAGEAGKAAIGLLLSDPAVTTPTIQRVLPAAILYDLLLSPVVLWLVTRAAVQDRPVRAPAPDFASARHLAGVFRQASAGAAPGLRLAGTGATLPRQSLPRKVPKLRLAETSSPAAYRTSPASPVTSPARPGGGRVPRLNFAGDHPAPTPRQLRSPGKGWLRGTRDMTARPRGAAALASRRGPAKGWLRPAKPPAPARRRSPAKGWLRPASKPRPNWYTRGPSTRWLRQSRSRSRWRTRRTTLPGALLAGVRTLLPKPKGPVKPKGARW